MTATFIHDGDAIAHTPDSDLPAGSVVVQGPMIGISKRPLKANEPGSLHLVGVYEVPKASGGGTALGVGAKVYWDEANQRATGVEAGAPMGRVATAAGDADVTVQVRLIPSLSV